MIRASFPREMAGRKKKARKAKRAVAVLTKGYKKLTEEWPAFFDMEHKR